MPTYDPDGHDPYEEEYAPEPAPTSLAPIRVNDQAELAAARSATTSPLLPTEAWGEQTLARARDMIQIHRGLRALAVQETDPSDWVMTGDKPYLAETGALKFAQFFGVVFDDTKVDAVHYNDERGPVIEFFATTTAKFQGRYLTDSSSAATSDGFFNGTETDKETGKKRPRRLPLSEIRRSHVRNTAISRARGRATRKLLALTFSKEEVVNALKAAGKDPGRIPGITYRGSEERQAQAATGKGTMNATKKEIADMLLEMADGDKGVAGGILERLTEFEGKDGTTVAGVKSIADLTDKRAEVAVHRVREEWRKFKAEPPEGALTQEGA